MQCWNAEFVIKLDGIHAGVSAQLHRLGKLCLSPEELGS